MDKWRMGGVIAVALLAAAGTTSAQEATSQGAARLGDAEIAAIVVAANAVDADLGEWAAQRATRAEVKEFGKTMARDHRAVNRAGISFLPLYHSNMKGTLVVK